jgi:hypothetical protein
MRGMVLISIIVVALVMGLAIGSTSFLTSTSTTGSVTTTVTPTSTTTGASRLYELQFIQQGVCSPPVWLAPWAVALNNQTIVRPSNATLPLSENRYEASPSYAKYSTITFSVPNGSYNYTVYPSFLSQTGVVTIDGSDVVIQVHGAPIPCTTATG